MKVIFIATGMVVPFAARVLGTPDVGLFLICYLFALVGVFISLRIHATARDATSPRTPFRFDLAFLLSDNVQRILLNLVLVFIALRFSPQLSRHEVNEWDSFLLGFGIDKIPELLRNKGVIDKPKTQL